MYKIAIVEDQKEYRNQIQNYIAKFSKENQIKVNILLFENGKEIIDSNEENFDLIFLDIDMPIVNGMEAATFIRKKDNDVIMVFITNLTQYAIEGYAVGALDYILKPIKYSAFSLRFKRALEKVKKKENCDFLINTADGMKCINSEYVFYIEIENRRLHYHTKGGEYVTRGILKQQEERLVPYHFVKCNQYYLVNLKHVSEIIGSKVVVGGAKLEISRRSKSAFAKALTDYIGGM